MLIGLSLVTAFMPIAVLMLIAIVGLWLWPRISVEERMMIKAFG